MFGAGEVLAIKTAGGFCLRRETSRGRGLDTCAKAEAPENGRDVNQAAYRFGGATVSPWIISRSKNLRPIGLSPPSSQSWKCATAVLVGERSIVGRGRHHSKRDSWPINTTDKSSGIRMPWVWQWP